PGPADLPAVETHGLDGMERITVAAEDAGPLAALAFKIATDPTTGRLVMVRVYSGTLRKGDRVLNPRTGREDRIGRLVRVHADRREEIAAAFAGEIVAVAGLRGFGTGDTLCGVEYPIMMEPPVFPEPVVSMGELHLEVVRERLRTEFGLETGVGAPEIAYRETITAEAEADYLLRKQSGGSGMYARVILSVRPSGRGAGVTIENRVTGGNIPSQFHSAVRKGIEEAARGGVLGYPLVDAEVRILDGAAHVKDSNEPAFRLAAAEAMRMALRRAGPVLLEPIMKVELSTPLEHQGDLLADLNRRRGKVLGIENRPTGAVVNAEVPLGELWGYANAIRSLSRGRAAYSMTPAHFEPVPDAVASTVLKDAA